MKEKIGIHNAKVLSMKGSKEEVKCNCRNKNTCPIPGECNQKNVLYQVEVWGDNKIMYYYGSTEDFKTRYYKHKASFNKRQSQHTTLSSYNWKLEDNNGSTQLLNCQWNSSDIDTCQMLKYQSSEPHTYIFS